MAQAPAPAPQAPAKAAAPAPAPAVAPAAAPPSAAPVARPRPVQVASPPSTDGDRPSRGSTVGEASEALTDILARESDPPAAAKPRRTPPPPAAAEETPPEPKPETPDDTEEDAAEEAEPDTDEDDPEDEDAAEAEDTDEGDEPDDTAKVTVKIDGKTEKVALAELKQSFMRQADYTRKTQALAEERNQFHATRQAVTQERMQYAQLLPALAKQVQAEQTDPAEMERLRLEDPMQYVLRREEQRDRDARVEAAKAEYERVRQEQLQDAQAETAANLAKERDKLLAAIPAWKDADRRDKDRAAIRQYGLKLGWSEEELSAVTDHRAVMVLLKAMRYDQAAAKPAPLPNPPAPRAPTPQPMAARAVPPRHVTELTRAKQRLSKTGSARDAAAVIEHLL